MSPTLYGGGRGIEEPADGLAGALIAFGGALGQEMSAAMNVGVIAFVDPGLGINDLNRLLGRRGAVEVDQRLAMDLAGQDRKVLADGLDIVGWPGGIRGVDVGHGHITEIICRPD